MMRLLIIQADAPTDADKITVTVRGPKNADRARVVKVLAHLFGTGEEWDGPAPNVELVAEHIEVAEGAGA